MSNAHDLAFKTIDGAALPLSDFDGKVILVTGGATGLGAAIAVGHRDAVLIQRDESRFETEAVAEFSGGFECVGNS